MGEQQEAEITADLDLSTEKLWNNTHSQSRQQIQPEHCKTTDRPRGLLAISPHTHTPPQMTLRMLFQSKSQNFSGSNIRRMDQHEAALTPKLKQS